MYIYITQWNTTEKLAKDNQYWREIKPTSQLKKGEQIIDLCYNRFAHSSAFTIHDNADRIIDSAKLETKVFV